MSLVVVISTDMSTLWPIGQKEQIMLYCQISYVTKQPRLDPFNPILEVGGPVPDGYGRTIWRCSLSEAIKHAQQYECLYFTLKDGIVTPVEIQHGRSGLLHMQTVADSTTMNNLLHLDDFPIDGRHHYVSHPVGIIKTEPRGFIPGLSGLLNRAAGIKQTTKGLLSL